MKAPSESGRNLLLVLGIFHAFNLIVMALLFVIAALFSNRPHPSGTMGAIEMLFAVPPFLASIGCGYIAARYLWFRGAWLVVVLLGVMEGVSYFNFQRGSARSLSELPLLVAQALLILAGPPVAYFIVRRRSSAISPTTATAQQP